MKTVNQMSSDLSKILASVEKCHSLAATIETIAAEDSSVRRDAMSCICESVVKQLRCVVTDLDNPALANPIKSHWFTAVQLFGLANAASVLIGTEGSSAAEGLSGTTHFLTKGLESLKKDLGAVEVRAAA